MPKVRIPLPSSVDPSTTTLTDAKIILRRLGKTLGYQCPEDWYALRQADIARVKGLSTIVGNPIKAGRLIHPDLNPLLFDYRKLHSSSVKSG
jgi:hypothetical protein